MKDEPSLSLSQLIYSQSSQKPTDPYASVTTRKKKKRKRSLFKKANSDDDDDDDDDDVNDFYGLSQSEQEAAQPRIHTRRAVRQKKRRKKRPGEMKINKNSRDYWVLETQAQAEERLHSTMAHERHYASKERWKKRKIDLREEEDIGGVYERITRNYWNPSMRVERKFKVDIIDPSTGTYYADKDDTVDDQYWERGKTAPCVPSEVPMPPQLLLKKKELPPDNPAKYPHPKPIFECSQVGPFHRTVKRQSAFRCEISGVYFHQGTLCRLVTQQLMERSGTTAGRPQDEDTRLVEDQLLTSLYKYNHNDRLEALMYESGEQGLNAELFRKHVWKNRTKAAKALVVGAGQVQQAQHITKRQVTSRISVYGAQGAVIRQSVVKHVSVREGRVFPVEYEQDDEDLLTHFGESNEDAGALTKQQKPYRFIKGTEPPTPQFPLDEVNVEFGARDPNAQAARFIRIAAATSEVTLAVLLARLAAAKRDNKHADVANTHDTIASYLHFLRTENDIQFYSAKIRLGAFNVDVAAVSQYLTLMKYCQYTANSDVEAVVNHDPITMKMEEDVKEEEDVLTQQYDVPFKSVNHRAEDMSMALEHMANRLGLDGFPRLHFTCALSNVTRELPPEAAMLFARHDDNPFNIVRRTLEFLEDNEMLVSHASKVITSKNIITAHLEYILYEAAEVIENNCIARAPVEIDYRAWVCALRFGSLLMCSGNYVGGTAHLYRSYRSSKINVDRYFSQESKPIFLPHEVRNSMPKFEQARLDAAEVTLTFLRSVDSEGGRQSELVVSALGWSQAIAQMVGVGKRGIIETDSRWKEIRLLHARHARQLAPLDVSQLPAWRNVEGIYRNDILDRLADNLESTPYKIDHWRDLVKELGPVAFKKGKDCSPCEECKRVREGLKVDHATREGPNWWARARLSWWGDHLLRMSENYRSTPFKDAYVVKKIKERIKEEDLAEVTEGPESDTKAPSINFGWLEQTIKLAKKRVNQTVVKGKVPAVEEREVSIDHLLPKPIVANNTETVGTSAALIADMDESEWEIHSYKVVLAAHLWGAHHPAVMKGVWLLIARYVTRSRRSDEAELASKENAMKCLKWLASQGLDTLQLMMDFIAHNEKLKVANGVAKKAPVDQRIRTVRHQGSRKYTAEAEMQLGLALKKYGRNFIQIRDKVPFFQTWRKRGEIYSFDQHLKSKRTRLAKSLQRCEV